MKWGGKMFFCSCGEWHTAEITKEEYDAGSFRATCPTSGKKVRVQRPKAQREICSPEPSNYPENFDPEMHNMF